MTRRPRIPFTEEGYQKVTKEHEELSEKRKGAVQELTTARDMGDRSENAAYKSARFKLSGIDRRLRHLKHLLQYGIIVQAPSTGTIGIGSVVTVEQEGIKQEFTIVGGFESDVSSGRLSNLSPVGKALTGKSVGDLVTIHTPAGPASYTILSIS
jgi:transcription elongation GreA/GreB family factor